MNSANEVLIGVNTGFGGSADTRTTETERLQQMLTRELSYGILPPGSRGHRAEALSESALHCRYDLSLENPPESQHLPWAWVRAAILIRINSLIKGYSAVRPVIVERLQDLLSYDIVPMIPLRGSISASGDLNPLAYISGAIQGKATIQVLSKKTTVGPAYADDALRSVGLKPITLKAKEGLAIVNGTAISTAAGALALHDAHNLAVLAQVLTAMSVEALLGTTESFHPFFAESRPHPGQVNTLSNRNGHITQLTLMIKDRKRQQHSSFSRRLETRPSKRWNRWLSPTGSILHPHRVTMAGPCTGRPYPSPPTNRDRVQLRYRQPTH